MLNNNLDDFFNNLIDNINKEKDNYDNFEFNQKLQNFITSLLKDNEIILDDFYENDAWVCSF